MWGKAWICGLASVLALLGGCTSDSGEAGDWMERANLDGRETPEELYEAALHENTMVLYTDSTRIFDTKSAFESAYPGLTVEVHDIRSVDIITLLLDSANRPLCDVVICSDTGGVMYNELAPQGVLVKYVPYDIMDSILPQYNDRLLEFVGEGVQLFYNSQVHDAPPVSNWWELTEPRFKGKIYLGNPVRSHSTFTLMCAMIQNSDEMAEAYYALYGQVLDVPEGSTAGEEFWRMLSENELQFTSSSEEAMERVGLPGQSDPPVAIMVSSKARKAEAGFHISPIFDIAPSTGVYTPNNVMLAAGAQNVSTAKLFIRFLLGESDGAGEGYRPYLQEGTWSVRADVESSTKIPLEAAGFWRMDRAWYAQNSPWILAYWLRLQAEGEG